ncbi:MAG: ABC transporter permease [Leucobacter sp.]
MKALLKQREFITIGGVVLLIVIVGLFHSTFASPDNLARVLNSTVILALLGAGSAIVIITKNIDVSVGSTLALSGIVGAMIMRDGAPIWIAVLAVIAVGAVLGAINGIGVTYGHVPSIVMTLGTLTAYRGISFLVTGGYSIESLPSAYRQIGRIDFLGLPVLVWATIVLVAVIVWIMARTKFGRSFYATGDNSDGAYLVGISTNGFVILAFTLSGMLAGLAALVFLAQIGSIGNQAGQGIEMRAIAAAVIGGVSLTGGVGTVVGAVFGALFITTATSSLSFLGIPGSWSDTVIGAILLLALFADSRVRALVSKRRLTSRYAALEDEPGPSHDPVESEVRS